MEEVVVAENTIYTVNKIPAEAIETLARSLLPTIREYFESADGKREFEEWKASQIRKAA